MLDIYTAVCSVTEHYRVLQVTETREEVYFPPLSLRHPDQVVHTANLQLSDSLGFGQSYQDFLN